MRSRSIATSIGLLAIAGLLLSGTGCGSGGNSTSSTASLPSGGGGDSQSQGSIVIDAATVGSPMTKDQLGANLLIQIPESVDPTYVPLLANAGIGLLRWPGGRVSDYYHWQTNSFGPCPNIGAPPAAGTDFDNWMQTIAQPLNADVAITVNYGSDPNCIGPADPNEAAAWVDYANNVKHYGIKYWTVGNEQYFSETDLHSPAHDPTTYANAVATQFYPLMKSKDPTILVGIDMAFGNLTYDVAADTWDQIVLANAQYDFVEVHYYPESDNIDDDTQLLTKWSDQVATNYSTIKSLLAANGHPNTPIFLGEFVRDSGSGVGAGHESVSIVDALFTAIVVAESSKAGVALNAVFLGIDNCYADSLSSPVSTAYGWQSFGSFGLYATGTPNFIYSCPGNGVPKQTAFPKARAYEILTQFIKPGEHNLQASSSDSSVRAYAATSGAGYGVLLINTDSQATHIVPINIANTAAQSFNATAVTYGKAEYDQSKQGVWAGPTSSSLGAVGSSFNISLPPWSMTLIKIQI